METVARRVSFAFLCLAPFVAIGVVAVRGLRVAGVYQSVGAVLFATIVGAAWLLGGHALRVEGESARKLLAMVGGFFVVPFALIALLWVGLGPPAEATARENVMRYEVLLVSSLAVSSGFIFLKEALREAGERTYSIAGFAAALLGGSAYLVWMSFTLGSYVVLVRDGKMPAAIESVLDVLDILLTVGCLLTYLATAAFATAMGRVRWMGRGASWTYAIVNLVLVICLLVRGMSFPDVTTLATPWYTQPGFVAGIPAIPFVMPFLLGVVLLRRAGDRTG